MNNCYRYTALACLIIAVFCPKALAEVQKKIKASYKQRYVLKSDVKDASGEVSLKTMSFALSNTYKLYDKIPVDLGFKIKHFDLNNDSGIDLPETMQSRSLRLGIRFPAPFAESQRLFAGLDLMPQWNSAKDHNFASEAFRLNFAPSIIYMQEHKLIFACGVWVRPEYDNALIPFVGFLYHPDEKLSFNFLSAEPSISYQLTDKTKILLEFGFLSHEFEVTSGINRGDIILIRDWEVGLGLEHDCNESWRGKFSLGLAFEQKYENVSANQAVSLKNSLYAAYKFALRF